MVLITTRGFAMCVPETLVSHNNANNKCRLFNRLTYKIPFNPQNTRYVHQNQDNFTIQINASVTSRTGCPPA